MELDVVIGTVAAICTTGSYVPQLKKCWQTGSAGDLSLRTFTVLATGKALWIIYGGLKVDWLIVAANGISLALLLGILFFKLRELHEAAGQGGGHANDNDQHAGRSRADSTAVMKVNNLDY